MDNGVNIVKGIVEQTSARKCHFYYTCFRFHFIVVYLCCSILCANHNAIQSQITLTRTISRQN